MVFSEALIMPGLLREGQIPKASQMPQKKLYLYSFSSPIRKEVLEEGDDYFPETICSRNDPSMRPLVSSLRRELEKTFDLNLFTTYFSEITSYPGTQVGSRGAVPTREYSLIVNLGGNVPEPLTVFLSPFIKQGEREYVLGLGDGLLFKGLESAHKIKPVRSLYETEGTTGLFDDDSHQRFLVCNFVNADGYFVHYAYSG